MSLQVTIKIPEHSQKQIISDELILEYLFSHNNNNMSFITHLDAEIKNLTIYLSNASKFNDLKISNLRQINSNRLRCFALIREAVLCAKTTNDFSHIII